MLFCCGEWFNKTEKKVLTDTYEKKERILEIGSCPKCGTLKAHLSYKTKCGAKKEFKPKNKSSVKKFIADCLKAPYYSLKELTPKKGSKQNVYWFYQSNGIVKDFNNEKRGDCFSELINCS